MVLKGRLHHDKGGIRRFGRFSSKLIVRRVSGITQCALRSQNTDERWLLLLPNLNIFTDPYRHSMRAVQCVGAQAHNCRHDHKQKTRPCEDRRTQTAQPAILEKLITNWNFRSQCAPKCEPKWGMWLSFNLCLRSSDVTSDFFPAGFGFFGGFICFFCRCGFVCFFSRRVQVTVDCFRAVRTLVQSFWQSSFSVWALGQHSRGPESRSFFSRPLRFWNVNHPMWASSILTCGNTGGHACRHKFTVVWVADNLIQDLQSVLDVHVLDASAEAAAQKPALLHALCTEYKQYRWFTAKTSFPTWHVTASVEIEESAPICKKITSKRKGKESFPQSCYFQPRWPHCQPNVRWDKHSRNDQNVKSPLDKQRGVTSILSKLEEKTDGCETNGNFEHWQQSICSGTHLSIFHVFHRALIQWLRVPQTPKWQIHNCSCEILHVHSPFSRQHSTIVWSTLHRAGHTSSGMKLYVCLAWLSAQMPCR